MSAASGRSRTEALLASLRPLHWTKNVLLFAALLFAGRWNDGVAVQRTLAAFALFCAVASAVYLLNDLQDRAADTLHPEKRRRPIASGELPPAVAAGSSAALLVLGQALALLLSVPFGIAVAAYIALMLAYTYALKQIVILDIFVIASGVVLRAVAGALVIPVVLSPWFLVCVSFLALLLAGGKRRQEFMILAHDAPQHRTTLETYSPQFLDIIIGSAASGAAVSYALYTLAPSTVAHVGSTRLLSTFPLVVFAIFRYLFLLYREKKGGDPVATILSDQPLLLAFGAWLLLVFTLLRAVT